MFKKISFFLMIRLLAITLVACAAPVQSREVPVEPPAPPTESRGVITDIPSTAASPAEAPSTERSTVADSVATSGSYPIVDTDQTYCFSESGVIPCGQSYNGQDAQYEGLQPAYQDNGDGTITDLNTGLMWIQDPGEKTYYTDALEKLENYSFAGYDDWRLPTIKELYSLALFSGVDASVTSSSGVDGLVPFIDTGYFVFRYGDESGGNRVIDSQWLTSTVYDSTVMNGQRCFFGFNFADGRIKCYPLNERPGANGYFALFVRGGDEYGLNNYVDNGDGTITDQATGLTWTQNDNGDGMLWAEALTYCELLSLGGSDDWRLPNIKELHSIVDYSRSPDITDSPAIDPLFNLTSITNEAGQPDYGFYWSSTTLISYPNIVANAAYISFGRALGHMEEFGGWVDVHGAGAQRSDPKVGVSADYQLGHGPQGDARRSDNYVLCVRGGQAQRSPGDHPTTLDLPSGDIAVPPGDQQAPSPGGSPQQPGGREPDFAASAQQLGVTEEALRDALGPPPPNFKAAAAKLGVSVEALQNALGVPQHGGRP